MTPPVHTSDMLMHFQDDRTDRDRLEPAARRADDLMNLFAGGSSDLEKGALFVSEIQIGIERVPNPKSAGALRDARVDIVALLNAMRDRGADHTSPRQLSPVRH